ncbi:MAG: hypothetical protein JXQ85_05210 [Cognatishimia sp.]|uniref:hypothetical protein n=1 Tax=Cognatishimia sp. TaxID=2211648 RepID=UPI003B8C6C2E
MVKTSNRYEYFSAFATTVFTGVAHPFVMTFMDYDTFSMAHVLEVAKSDTPFFVAIFAAINFGMAWFTNWRASKKET